MKGSVREEICPSGMCPLEMCPSEMSIGDVPVVEVSVGKCPGIVYVVRVAPSLLTSQRK